MNHAYVSPFLFTGMVAFGVGDAGAAPFPGEACGSKAFRISIPICGTEEDLHEDQLREPGSCSRFDRFADRIKHRRTGAVAQGQFLVLDQRAESGCRKVRLGTGLRRVFSFGVGCRGSVRVHRGPGRTSPEKKFYRGTKIIRRALWIGMARGQDMKLLKQFHGGFDSRTPLKWSVNENSKQAFIF